MTFNDFIKKYKLKNKATSNMKIQQVLSSLSLNDVGIYLRDGLFKSDIGVGNLHPFRGSYWVFYINENYFDSYGIVGPKKLSKFSKKETDIVYIQNIRFKKLIVIVLVIVYI